MENTLHELTLLQENPEKNFYELVLDDGEELSLYDLKQLNANGYVYHSELTDVDYEDEDENGETITLYMNIYYFSKASDNIHEEHLPL